jgi:phosphoribosylformylglycinamidine synthase
VADCAVTTVAYDSYAGESMAMGERTPLAVINGPASGRMAVAEAITNIAGAYIGDITDIKLSANWMCAAGYGREDEILYDTVWAVGMEFCPQLGLTIPVGKDSMSMRTTWRDGDTDKSVTAPVSLIVSAFSTVLDVRKTLTPALQLPTEGNCLFLFDVSGGQCRLGGSALAQVYGQLGNEAPDVEQADVLKALFELMQSAIAADLLLAYHDRSDGGLVTTLLEMAFAGHCGLDISGAVLGSDVLASLFNEEVGAVLQVAVADRDKLVALAADLGVSNQLLMLGQAVAGDTVKLGTEFKDSRLRLQRLWTETSYRIQSLRDNPDCADEEFAAITEDDPGLSAKLSYDVNEDIAAPYLNLAARPQMAILREQGVNGHVEMAAAFERAGFASFDVHMSDLLAGRYRLDQFKGLVACGGFSYGDVLGAGEGWAKTILFNNALRDQFQSFFERGDSFTLGVCNGCQMVSNLHELIPGAELWPRFVRNRSEQFEARLSLVQVEESPSILLQGMAGSHLPIAVAHGEGRAEFSAGGQRQALEAANLVGLRFVNNDLSAATHYPANPNGSPGAITGLSSLDGRATIMMPHPERVFRAVLSSWAPSTWEEDGGWLRIFRNARVWLD